MQSWDLYTLDFPSVGRFIKFYGHRKIHLKQRISEPSELTKELPPSWHEFSSAGFNAIRWKYSDYPMIVCNGIKITNEHLFDWDDFELSRNIAWPRILVIDRDSNLPLNLSRTSITRKKLDFEDGLLNDIILDLIAFYIVCAPKIPLLSSLAEIKNYTTDYPLDRGMIVGLSNVQESYTTPVRFKELGWICDRDGASIFHRSFLMKNRTTDYLLNFPG